MQYFGGKQRIASQIAKALRPVALDRGAYVEPFVGGASVMSLVDAPIRIGADANEALITMWNCLSQGWTPPISITEEEYLALKEAQDPMNPMTAFAGFGVSFAGKWFGGFARGGEGRNYAANAAASIRKKMLGLGGVTWHAADYRRCPAPPGSVIYCDPPYAGTTQYGAVAPFSWDEFWEWCREKSRNGHPVFVSEYNAPDDFRSCLVIETKTDIRTKKNGKEARLERLFVHTEANF